MEYLNYTVLSDLFTCTIENHGMGSHVVSASLEKQNKEPLQFPSRKVRTQKTSTSEDLLTPKNTTTLVESTLIKKWLYAHFDYRIYEKCP